MHGLFIFPKVEIVYHQIDLPLDSIGSGVRHILQYIYSELAVTFFL